MHCLLAWTLQETHYGSPKGILMSTIVCGYKVETFTASFDLGDSFEQAVRDEGDVAHTAATEIKTACTCPFILDIML